MRSWLRRIFKLLIIVAGISYLLINAVLNLPFIRNKIYDQLVGELQRPVEMGYLYINWRVRPTLSSLQIGNEATVSEDNPVVLKINYFQIKPAWRNFKPAFDQKDFLTAVESVYIGKLMIDMYKPPANAELLKKLPEIETKIQSWKFSYFVDRSNIFSISGKQMEYWRIDRPLEYQLTALMGEKIRGEGSISFLPHLRLSCDLSEFIFPSKYWMNIENRWEGSLDFQKIGPDRQLLSARLTGTPAVVGEIPFPEVEFEVGIVKSNQTLSADTFTFSSDYLYSDWSGEIINKAGEVDIRGVNELDLARLINHYSVFHPELQLSALEPSFLEASMQLGGDPGALELAGNVSLDELKFGLAGYGLLERIRIKDWYGDIGDGQLSWQRGGAEISDLNFKLQTGFTELGDAGLVNSFTGDLLATDFELGLFSEKQMEVLGAGRAIDMPTNISFSVGEEELQLATVVREGRLEFENTGFSDIWMLASYSTQENQPAWFGGSFVDGDGNEFEISGGADSVIQLKGSPRRMNELLELSGHEKLQNRYLEFDNTDFFLQFDRPFQDWSQYYGHLSFSDASLRFPEKEIEMKSLNGEIRIFPDKIDFSSIYSIANDGQFQLNGIIEHRDFFQEGSWDLTVSGQKFASNKILPSDHQFYFEDLDFSLEVMGDLLNPDIYLSAQTETVSIHNISVEDVELYARRQNGDYEFRLDEAKLGGGDLVVVARSENEDDLWVGFKLEQARLESVLGNFEFMRENIRGPISLDGQMQGKLGELESWIGGISVVHPGILMKKFPDLAGIHRVANLQKIGEDIDIEPATYNLNVENGRIQLDGININAREKNLRLQVQGYLALNGEIDTTYELELRGEALALYLQDLIGELYRGIGLSRERRLTIRFFIQGTIMELDISLDTEKIRRDFRQQFIDSIFSERLGRPINRLLEALFD